MRTQLTLVVEAAGGSHTLVVEAAGKSHTQPLPRQFLISPYMSGDTVTHHGCEL